jgi:hypothetical protein
VRADLHRFIERAADNVVDLAAGGSGGAVTLPGTFEVVERTSA